MDWATVRLLYGSRGTCQVPRLTGYKERNPPMHHKLLLTTGLLAAGLAVSAQATLISYVGFEDPTAALGWRSTSVSKAFDIGAPRDNAYGTDGYVVFINTSSPAT